jgi:hypothetical protein
MLSIALLAPRARNEVFLFVFYPREESVSPLFNTLLINSEPGYKVGGLEYKNRNYSDGCVDAKALETRKDLKNSDNSPNVYNKVVNKITCFVNKYKYVNI